MPLRWLREGRLHTGLCERYIRSLQRCNGWSSPLCTVARENLHCIVKCSNLVRWMLWMCFSMPLEVPHGMNFFVIVSSAASGYIMFYLYCQPAVYIIIWCARFVPKIFCDSRPKSLLLGKDRLPRVMRLRPKHIRKVALCVEERGSEMKSIYRSAWCRQVKSVGRVTLMLSICLGRDCWPFGHVTWVYLRIVEDRK